MERNNLITFSFKAKKLSEFEISKDIENAFFSLKELDSSKIQVFVHGSWADDTKTAFSDLDDFVIVDDDYLSEIATELKKVEIKFQQIDPIQHHGHWLVKKSLLKNYNNSYMPLFIMEKSICIIGSPIIRGKINLSYSHKNLISNIITTCKNIELFYDLFKEELINVYNLKQFVGSIALIPPMIFQLRGKDIDKRTAILNANKIFPNYCLKLIKWATDLRLNWDTLLLEPEYQELFKKSKSISDPEEWRIQMDRNSPVLNYEQLSSVQISQDLIDSFIRIAMGYIDEISFEDKTIDDYTNGYTLIENFAIENQAIIVGQFGNVEFPGISDLDVFICFEDENYKKGCELVWQFILSRSDLNYLFTHEPVFVAKSMLKDFKFLHTLYDLEINYNPKDIKLNLSLNKNYRDFLNILWSYSFVRSSQQIKESHGKYINIRLLLLTLKNVHRSIDNLEKIFNLESSNPLKESEIARQLWLKNGKTARTQIEKCLINAFIKLDEILSHLDLILNCSTQQIQVDNMFYSWGSENISNSKENDKIIYLNKLYFNLFYEIIHSSGKSGRRYFKALKKYYQSYQKIGGVFYWHVMVIPATYLKKPNSSKNTLPNLLNKVIKFYFKKLRTFAAKLKSAR